MTKKPFIVYVELEIGVMAESEDEAISSLRSEWIKEEFDMMTFQRSSGIVVLPFNRMPAGWDKNCILYGRGDGDTDVTAQEALEMTE